MKTGDKLRTHLGANMAESLGHHMGGETTPTFATRTDRYAGLTRIRDALRIPVDQIHPDPEQPRKEFNQETLAELAASLREHGQLQPIRVRWDDQRWIVISGERRYRAAVLAGLRSIDAIEVTTEDLGKVLDEQLVENLLREDLRPIEQALAFRRLMDQRKWTQAELASYLHIHQSSVARALSLLTLPADVQAQVNAGEVPPSSAHLIARLADAAEQREAATLVAAGAVDLKDLRRRKPATRKPRAKPYTFKAVAGWKVRAEPGRGATAAGLGQALRAALTAVEADE